MKVVSFLATLPAKQVRPLRMDSHKVQTLLYFAEGAQASGDTSVVSHVLEYQPCDVAVILGYVHDHGKHAPHLALRQQILARQQHSGGRTVVVDSNLFLYHDENNPYRIFRYGLDGVFPGQAEYCDQRNTNRWRHLSAVMGITAKPWRANGNHILICLQRHGGWSMKGLGVSDWAIQTVVQLRRCTQRPIRLRAHPGDRHAATYVPDLLRRLTVHNIADVTASEPNCNLMEDLRNCWAVVNHNSSPAVAAAIEGVPVFATDPELSQAREVVNRDLDQIESPALFDREAWLERLAQFHWSHNEVRDGHCWRHMRQWVKAPV